jgi:HEAT repeat protein
VVGALIAGGFSLYQARYNAQLERENALLQDQIASARALQEREQQRRETEAEITRMATLHAQTRERYVQAYRSAVRADPRIAQTQILTMSRPLEIANIYVRMKLHQDARPGYELDPILLQAEARRDPNALMRAGRRRLESLASTALEPGEAIRRYKHCVIVGDPGAGKTTLLKYLTLASLDGHLKGLPDLPMHIELNAFVNSGCSDLLDFASLFWEAQYAFPKEEARSYIEEQLRSGKALLLLDALDETLPGETTEIAEASYRRAVEAIMQMATRYYQSPIVVTVRKATYQQRMFLVGFTELEVLDFRSEDIAQFVNKWFAYSSSSQKWASARDLNTRLEHNPRIQALAANPLLLSLIVLVYEAQLDLPDRRAELYKQCVETLLTRWDANRDIRRRRQFKPEHKRQLLEEIAWHFHIKGQRYFSEREVKEVIAGFLPAIGLPEQQDEQILQEIASENGLLKEQARGYYGFLHMMLQEYFVAQYATTHHCLDRVFAYSGDLWWEEVILLYAGLVPDASPLLQKLVNPSEEICDDIFQTNLVLAGHCLAARPTVRQTVLREEVVSRLFTALKQASYSLMSQHIADALSKIGKETINASLLELLADPAIDAPVRVSIATALGTADDHASTPQLLKLLADPAIDSPVRVSIATALGAAGSHTSAPQLLELLADPAIDSSVRMSIATALGAAGSHTSAPQLLELLADPAIDSLVRASIATALGTADDHAVVQGLHQLLDDPHYDLSVKVCIATTLDRLGDQSVVPGLLHILTNPQADPSLRIHIAAYLNTRGERSAAPVLLHILRDPQTDPTVSESVATTLGVLGDQSVIPELLRLLTVFQNKPDVQMYIAIALGTLGDHSVIPQLLQLLADPKISLSVGLNIAATLRALDDRSIVPEILGLLSDPQLDPIVQAGIVHVLEQVADDETTLRVLAALLPASVIADDMYCALWHISRRIGVRICATNGSSIENLSIIQPVRVVPC